MGPHQRRRSSRIPVIPTEPTLSTENQQPTDEQIAELLREISGVDDRRASAIVSAWRELPIEEAINTVNELRRVTETDPSFEFESIFRAATTFPNPQIRLESILALANGGSIATAQTLLSVLQQDEIAEIRATAAVALHAFGDPSQSRKIPATILSRVKSALREVIDIDEPIVRGKALIALSALRDDDVADLIDTVFDEAIGVGPLMSDVLTAMGETNDRSWLPTIEDAFYSDNSAIRIAAVLAFGKIAQDDDVESLSELFDDHVLAVQMATVKALEEIGTAQAREMLELAVSSSEPEVQQLAQAAIDALKADDELIYAVSPAMIERGLFGVPASARGTNRDLARYDAPTEEGWANVTPEGQEVDVPVAPEDIGEDYEDYLESEEFFRDSNTN